MRCCRRYRLSASGLSFGCLVGVCRWIQEHGHFLGVLVLVLALLSSLHFSVDGSTVNSTSQSSSLSLVPKALQ
jgi:hypothetical protein